MQNVFWDIIISPKKTIKEFTENKRNLLFVLTVATLIGVYYGIADPEETDSIFIAVSAAFSLFFTLIGLYLGSYLIHTLSRLMFKGKGTFSGMLLGLGLTGIITLIGIVVDSVYFLSTGNLAQEMFENSKHAAIDIVQIVLAVWWLVITVVTISIVESIQWWKSFIALILGAVLLIVLFITLIAIFGFSLIGFIFLDVLTTGAL